MVPDAFPCVDAESVLVSQLRPTLCGPTIYSLPGSSVHGILQARRLEWVAIPLSRVSSQPGTDLVSPTLQTDSLPSEPPGKPQRQLVIWRKC